MNRLPAFLALAGALLVAACDDEPTSPRSGQRPSALIVDGANGGDNTDVFFLPPLVPNPSALFDAAFNPNLTSAVIQVCPVSVAGGECTGAAVAKFGNIAGATGPIVVSAQDEHYLALWHTGESALADGLYQIQVFFSAPAPGDEPEARADIQVVSSGRELKNVSNETIGLLDGRTLPIKVRFETDCESANCVSEIVDNDGDELVLATGDGALVLQAGWLPEGISKARVTLQRHDPGPDNDCVGNAAFTGPGLVAQTEACLQVTTDPVLVPGPETGIQQKAFIFACLEEPTALREFMQIIKADDGLPLQALPDVDDTVIERFDRICQEDEGEGIGGAGLESHPLVRLASGAVRAVTRRVGRLLEVKPLYAIDLGQGGEIDVGGFFSYFTFGVQASAEPVGETRETAPVGSVVSLSVLVTGSTHHEPEAIGTGLPGIDVTFTTEGARLSDPRDEGETLASAITVPTGFGEDAGIATVNLTVGAGTNVVTAVAVVGGEEVTLPVIFSITGQTLISTSTVMMTGAPLAVVGAPVQLEATVSPAPTGAGSVEFFDGATSLGTAALVPNGTAALTVPSFALRAHTLSATFLGNSTHASSSSATITQHTVQRYTSLASFLAAAGDVAMQVQDFEAIAGGTPITSIIAGVLSVNSPFPFLGVTGCSGSLGLFGASSETFNPRTTPTEFGFNSFYDLLFQSTTAPRNALAFDVASQDPASQPAVLEITGITTPTARFFVSNTSGSETTPVFVGMIVSEPLNRVIVNEGREANEFPGNEEICLDNFKVASVSTP